MPPLYWVSLDSVPLVLLPVSCDGLLIQINLRLLKSDLGGIAAAIQASIGNVVAGSAFAAAQSVAMGGALPAIGYVSAAAIGAGAGRVAGQVLEGGEAPGDEEASDDDEAPKAGKKS